ncbi:MAG TPA: lysyl oxidase family protein [Actinomycetota bacterium]|nr:lysyl oxidase family protein [Actinomycetota bacterium]
MLTTGAIVPSANAAVVPHLRLIAPDTSTTAFTYGHRHRTYLDLGVLLEVTEAPFELVLRRSDYTQPVTISQVLSSGSTTETRAIDPSVMDGWKGLKDFFRVTVMSTRGQIVLNRTMRFCPNGYEQQRVNDSGPPQPTYPDACFSNPFTRGMVWGIDQGWAVPVLGYAGPRARLLEGTYIATVSIADPYVDMFQIDRQDASVHLSVTVVHGEEGRCIKCPAPLDRARQERDGVAPPTTDSPDPSLLPDLVALPSAGIDIQNRRSGKSFIDFGATVWNAGATDLVVEGFRRSDAAVMDAFQYFYSDGEPVARAPVGELEYDSRPGHEHWHFQQFAAYSLLDENHQEVVLSTKEAFCLAPTDALDLTLPGINLDPALGLSTACGGSNSIWTRETLPRGWGDTYYQGLPGQSFEITDLPNGTYFIRVEANPAGLLFEQSAANNVEEREIVLGGEPGARTVEVPPWNGIDTEQHRHNGRPGA